MITRAIEMEPFRILIYFAYIHSNGVAIFVGVFLPPFEVYPNRVPFWYYYFSGRD